jgi:hypothetical protein
MTKTIVNITMPFIVKKIEEILETYPAHPYQEAFANLDLRQSLIAEILNRVPNHYITVDAHTERQKQLTTPEDWCSFLEQTLNIESIIHEEIQKILLEQAQEINRHIPEVVQPGSLASDWFG